MASEAQLKYWESMRRKTSCVKGKHWKIKDTSKMHHSPWNKGKKLHYEVWSKSQKGIHLSPKSEFKKGEIRISGQNNYNWKGGTTSINEKIRKSLDYKKWRESVFERDNYTCIWCGTKSQKGIKVFLHADHIKSFAHHPELRFDRNNGRTLCIDCHKKTDTYGAKSKNNLIIKLIIN